MRPVEIIAQYTNLVCEQIRWKNAHELVIEELENHIIDQREVYLATGLDESTATIKAVEEMGSAIQVGAEFDHHHRPKLSRMMLSAIVILILTGVWTQMVLLQPIFGQLDLMFNYMVALVIGLVVMIVAYHIDFIFFGRFSQQISIGFMAMMGVNFLLGNIINNRSSLTACLPLMFPLLLVCILYTMKDKKVWGLLFCGGCSGLLCIFSVKIFSMFGMLLTISFGLLVLTIAIQKGWFGGKKLAQYLAVYLPTVGTILGICGYVATTPHIKARITVVFHPELDPKGYGYMASLLREMHEKSNFIGRGADLDGMQAWKAFGHDYSMTQLVYEYGWFVFVVIGVVVLFFLTTGFYLASKQKSMLGLTLSLAIMTTFTMEYAINLLSNVGMTIGQLLPMPFITYGNYSFIFNAMLMGFTLSIFRTGDVVKDRYVYPFRLVVAVRKDVSEE